MTIYTPDLEIFIRAFVAAILGFVIGRERKMLGYNLGGRTYALIAIGAATTTALAVERFPNSVGEVMAGVIVGIGFLGAGIIAMRKQGLEESRGLTTAASVWATAAVGVVTGSGDLLSGLLITLLIFFVLSKLNWLMDSIFPPSKISSDKPAAKGEGIAK